jgi:hypothetical protein
MNDGDLPSGVVRDTDSYISEQLLWLLRVYWSNRDGVGENIFCYLSLAFPDPKERRQKSKISKVCQRLSDRWQSHTVVVYSLHDQDVE